VRALIDVCIERRRTRIISGYDDPFLNRLIFARIRRILGGSVRAMLCGGAPLNVETQRFISICFCCPVLQGYGLTETCGAGTLCDAEDLDVGHVGAPLMCNRIMLREWTEGGYSPNDVPPSGEILISGPNVSAGYWRQPEKTREEFFDVDGCRWFATGDIGKVRSDGSFKIVGMSAH
jgi:long-chain acyl-CoA synthetase